MWGLLVMDLASLCAQQSLVPCMTMVTCGRFALTGESLTKQVNVISSQRLAVQLSAAIACISVLCPPPFGVPLTMTPGDIS